MKAFKEMVFEESSNPIQCKPYECPNPDQRETTRHETSTDEVNAAVSGHSFIFEIFEIFQIYTIEMKWMWISPSRGKLLQS